MAYVSYTELRNNLASYMDEVCDDRAPLFVTRQNARTVVLMAEDEYENSHGDRPPLEESRQCSTTSTFNQGSGRGQIN